jgi:hypothetical protein
MVTDDETKCTFITYELLVLYNIFGNKRPIQIEVLQINTRLSSFLENGEVIAGVHKIICTLFH